MRYQLIGLDLDGTLLNDKGRISRANREAIAAAHQAGAVVVPCTGRGWREAKNVLQDIPELEVGVFVTGAVVAEIASGRSIDMAVIEPHLALALVDHLRHEPEAVLVYREASLVGHDYLVTGDGELTANTQWWFQISGANVHFQRHVTADDLHHSLRVGMVAGTERLIEMSQSVAERFDGQVQLHHFPVLVEAGAARDTHILEIFASDVDKWRGLTWLADSRGIARDRIAAIGDHVNDLSMIRRAGCGIAVANAIEPLRAVADHVTGANTDDGVARALYRLIEGQW